MAVTNLKSLNILIEDAVKKNWNRLALTDFGGVNYQYKDLAEEVEKIHIMFEAAGVVKGDRVAICGKNSANWAVVFIACITAGVVAVPILHEFKPDTIVHLVAHSESKILFTDEAIWKTIDLSDNKNIEAVLFISELGMPLCKNKHLSETRNNINAIFGKKFPYSFGPDNVDYYKDSPADTCVINYTSGSTGMSKGVVLPFRSIWSNIRFCLDNIPFLKAGDNFVNMLPLAHLYGMVIEMLNPICHGCHCFFLTKLPSPKVILGAFAEVRPKLVITVPLVLEKIIRNKVFPVIQTPKMKLLLKMPVIKDKILAKIRTKLMDAFGGQLQELIIGGAALNKEVEDFLYKIDFPLTVGYGMTECGPLITYIEPKNARRGSVGKLTDRMEMKIDSPDPLNVPGNLWVKGDNVMKGYFHNEEATREVMPDDSGWMNTGDMCRVDEDGFIYISGRSKTMILGPSGQNIYPEEIEHKLNNLPLVAESLVVDEDGKLVALIYPDPEAVKAQNLSEQDVKRIMDENIKKLNPELPSYSKVNDFRIMEKEFEKTPKRSIKRFLYQK